MRDKLIKNTSYIDPNTGETFTKKSMVDKQFDSEEGYLFWNRKQHVKIFADRKLPDMFTWSEKGRIDELKRFMLKNNQLLVYRSGNVLKPLSIHDIGRVLEMSDRQARALVNKCKKHCIIKEIEIDGIVYFAFNPVYGLKSKRISLMMYLIFQEQLRTELPRWVVDKFAEQAEELKPVMKIIK